MPAANTIDRAERAREARLRRRAARHGLTIRKSRRRGAFHANGFGGYMIIDASTNGVVGGARFDLDLDDVERSLSN